MQTEPEIDIDFSSDEAVLVEYLDGELALDDRRDVEKRLAEETDLRETLARLERSWECLNLLERDGADKNFVETTLGQVVAAEECSVRELKKQAGRRFPRKAALVTVFGLLVFFAAFYVGERLVPDNPFLLRLASPVIERLDMYLMLLGDDPDLELLRLLAEKRLFLAPLPEGAKPIDPQEFLPSSSVSVWETLAMRPTLSSLKHHADRIERLDETLYNQFYWNNKRFHDLPWDRKLQLKTLHEAIEHSPRKVELLQTLRNFYTWFRSLQHYEQRDIRRQSLSVTERYDRIAALKSRLESDRASFYDAPSASTLLIAQQGSALPQLAEMLRELDYRQQEQLLNTAPEQIVSYLMRQYEARQEENGSQSP